jgi:hypothetical protein
MTTLTTFNVSDVIQTLADQEKINLTISGINDICYGLVISSDKTTRDFLNQHRGPLNFQVIDGDPIRVLRRPINASLTIDYSIAQSDCIPQQEGAPAVKFTRLDPENLPGSVQLSYIDPDRVFNVNTQEARHRYAKQWAPRATAVVSAFSDPTATYTRLILSASVDFILSADQARAMAYDYLYRTWSQSLYLSFEHPDISIEAGDTATFTADAGTFTLLFQESTLTRRGTNMLTATALLTSSGVTVTGGQADAYSTYLADDLAAWHFTQ